MNYSEWNTELQAIVEKAGEILLFHWNKPITEHKKIAGGFVTQADLASEEYLITALNNLFPADFWAEESGQSGTQNNGYCWVVDPLDGTTNFSRKIPYFCVSVALTHNNEPQVAAIYNPLSQDYFFAYKGGGAFCNGKPITVSSVTVLAEALIALGIPYKKSERVSMIACAAQIGFQSRTIRHFGAIALDMAHVATGQFDGVFFSHLGWWDVAAGMLLVQEAGGIATNCALEPITPDYLSCIAGPRPIHSALMRVMNSYSE